LRFFHWFCAVFAFRLLVLVCPTIKLKAVECYTTSADRYFSDERAHVAVEYGTAHAKICVCFASAQKTGCLHLLASFGLGVKNPAQGRVGSIL
jgi:hypothetical protein